MSTTTMLTRLPSFDEFMRNTFDVDIVSSASNVKTCTDKNNHWPEQMSTIKLYTPGAVVESPHMLNQTKPTKSMSLKRSAMVTPTEEFKRLNAEIMRQQTEISRLVHENEILKSKKRKIDSKTTLISQPTISTNNDNSPRNSPPQNRNIQVEFTVIVETSLNQSRNIMVMSNIEDYLVTWKETTYVISNIFTNKDDISHFYCPRFESSYPKKDYKIVVEKNEYRQLLNENPHVVALFKKRTWRVSLFSMDFVNFVRECIQE